MSDRGKDNPPPSSRKTQRYRQQNYDADQGRRTTLKVVAGGLLAVGAAALGINRLTQSPRLENRTIAPPTRPPERTQTLSPELQIYVNKLLTLNREIVQNPTNFKEIAPRVGEIAIEYFCRQLGYDAKRYQGKIRYQWNDEYQKSRAEESGCIQTQTFEDEYARVQVEREDLVTVNLDRVLHHDVQSKNIQPYPALSLFETLIHELHHVTSPVLPNPESNEPNGKIRGLGLLKPTPEFSKPGFVCFSGFRSQLEEAIVQDSTDRMIKPLGFSQDLNPNYQQWIDRYRIGVVDRFFGGDNKPLLRLHQQTKPVEFFTLIGQKYGAPPDKAAEAGENYVQTLILQGVFS